MEKERILQLQVIQPALIGLIDGTISTLAPMFAAAYIAGTEAALLIGMASACAAAISMGLSEGLSDDGSLTGRGTSLKRGLITGGATFLGGAFHTLPFIINDLSTALLLAYPLVFLELVLIAFIRKRYQEVPFLKSFVQVTLGGIVIVLVGILLGHA